MLLFTFSARRSRHRLPHAYRAKAPFILRRRSRHGRESINLWCFLHHNILRESSGLAHHRRPSSLRSLSASVPSQPRRAPPFHGSQPASCRALHSVPPSSPPGGGGAAGSGSGGAAGALTATTTPPSTLKIRGNMRRNALERVLAFCRPLATAGIDVRQLRSRSVRRILA